ncbi:MAG: hypothetical protein AAF591_23390 [Verrucomicrobiota bacterium]
MKPRAFLLCLLLLGCEKRVADPEIEAVKEWLASEEGQVRVAEWLADQSETAPRPAITIEMHGGDRTPFSVENTQPFEAGILVNGKNSSGDHMGFFVRPNTDGSVDIEELYNRGRPPPLIPSN